MLFRSNLLTQCTPVPVSVFCCFCISGFPITRTARKIPEKLYKKSAFQKLPGTRSTAGGGPPGLQAPWWRGPPPGRAGGVPGPPRSPLMPPLAYIYTAFRNPRGRNPFSRSHLCSAAAALPRSGAPGELFPAPCRGENHHQELLHHYGRFPDEL